MSNQSPHQDRDSLTTRADKLIDTFQETYRVAIESARKAESMTHTPAWCEQYATVTASHRDKTEAAAKFIGEVAAAVLQYGTDIPKEKAITNCVKALKLEREAHDAWTSRSVDPCRESVNNCVAILDACRRAARQAESQDKDNNKGFYEYVNAAVSRWPEAFWDESRGVVTIDQR